MSKDEGEPRRDSRKWRKQSAQEPHKQACLRGTSEGCPNDLPFGHAHDALRELEDDVFEDHQTAEKHEGDGQRDHQGHGVDVVADVPFVDVERGYRWRCAVAYEGFDRRGSTIPVMARYSALDCRLD
mgnify:CR=1 FL=1